MWEKCKKQSGQSKAHTLLHHELTQSHVEPHHLLSEPIAHGSGGEGMSVFTAHLSISLLLLHIISWLQGTLPAFGMAPYLIIHALQLPTGYLASLLLKLERHHF